MAKERCVELLNAANGCGTNAAPEGGHASTDSLPNHASFDRFLEPLSFLRHGENPDGVNLATPANSGAASSTLSRVSEKIAALARMVRRPAGFVDDGIDKLRRQRESGPVQQQRHPLKYLTLLAGVLTGIWGWRAGRSVERVVAGRYSDITYQIRRPDALSARINAFKVLVLGGLVVPGSAVAVASWRLQAPQPALVADEAQESHETLLAPNTFPRTRRGHLAETLPLPGQVEIRRLVGLYCERELIGQLHCRARESTASLA